MRFHIFHTERNEKTNSNNRTGKKNIQSRENINVFRSFFFSSSFDIIFELFSFIQIVLFRVNGKLCEIYFVYGRIIVWTRLIWILAQLICQNSVSHVWCDWIVLDMMIRSTFVTSVAHTYSISHSTSFTREHLSIFMLEVFLPPIQIYLFGNFLSFPVFQRRQDLSIEYKKL